jgi:hypothetical protein
MVGYTSCCDRRIWFIARRCCSESEYFNRTTRLLRRTSMPASTDEIFSSTPRLTDGATLGFERATASSAVTDLAKQQSTTMIDS